MSELIPAGIRRRIAAAALTLVAATSASCAGADFSAWKPYSPEGAAFTVSMPGTPVKEHQLAKNPRGNLETDIYSLDLAGGGFLTITDAVLPPGLNLEAGAAEMLESSLARIVESASGRVLYSRDVTISGYAAREVDVEVPTSVVEGGGRLRARVVLAGPRLYEHIGVLPNRRTAEVELAHFLDSFTLREARKTK